MTSTAPSTRRLERSTPSETAIRWPTTELLLSDPDGPDRARGVPSGVPADRRPDWLHHRPAWSHPACAGPHHPEPAGRNGGRAAAAATQHRCWGRYRALAPVGGQHGPEAVWTRRMVDRETRHEKAPVLEKAPPRQGCRHRPDRGGHADHPRRG